MNRAPAGWPGRPLMVDLHAHVLPGFDDGAETLGESLAMLAIAEADGIKTIVATPHYDGRDLDYPVSAATAVHQLRQATTERGLAIQVMTGFELALTPALVAMGVQVRSLGIGGSRYVLVELPLAIWSPFVWLGLRQLQAAGLRPILAHVERYPTIQRDWTIASELIQRGVRLQINAESLVGAGNRQRRRCALELVCRGWVHFIASDAHDSRCRTPELRQAADILAQLIGVEAMEALVAGNAAAVLADADLPPAPRFRRQRFFTGGLARLAIIAEHMAGA